jgi:hypothetical protein
MNKAATSPANSANSASPASPAFFLAFASEAVDPHLTNVESIIFTDRLHEITASQLP